MNQRISLSRRVGTLACVVIVTLLTLFGVSRFDQGAIQESAQGQETGGASDMDAVAIVERVAPAVVTVNNLQELGGFFSTGEPTATGAGTGFIINDQGYIVTNEHVVRNGQEFEVAFASGETRPAELIGADPLSDLAVVQVEGEVPATIALGDSETLRVGQPALALGSPLGQFTNTVTQGIISALNRDFPYTSPCSGTYSNLIQHDAAINPGNSGGPLINAAGEVIGVNTLGIEGAQGLFFAVPASTVSEITTAIIEDGEVQYPFFGVTGAPVTEQVAAQEDLAVDRGHYVGEVVPGEAAAEAGIEAGDVIVSLGGQDIDDRNTFSEVLYTHLPGDTVDVTVQRGDEEIQTQVTLGEREQLLPEECFTGGGGLP